MLKEWWKPGGTALRCKGWIQEAALRMLMNNLDPEVAEDPEALVVYGGTGRAARNRACLRGIIAALETLEDDETLLVQSGKAVGVMRTHPDAPRVLLANSLLVPAWANWDRFREPERLGLTMYGQMTAGSWIYIGTQGILQGTYETFAAAARTHFDAESLAGRLVLTAGLGGMGGAQPLAVTMNGGVVIAVEVDKGRIDRRLATRYCEKATDSVDEALALAGAAVRRREPLSIALHANAADVFPALLQRGVVPDLVTDQTSAHDPLEGYVPEEWSLEEAARERARDPKQYVERSTASMVRHVRAMVELMGRGAVAFDYGNNLRQRALDGGYPDAFEFPGFVPAFIRPQFCRGRGPFRWVALSGDPADIYRTDRALLELFPADEGLRRWILGCHAEPEALLAGAFDRCAPRFGFQGLPARICWLGYGERDRAGLLFNRMVASGELGAPIVIGRDHLDAGSVASPNRETEAMRDGSDAVSDWPLLNAMVNVASGASWVSFHHGGGVGMGFSQHAGQVIVADGTPEAGARLERVLSNDPLMGVLRHADAGYDEALGFAAATGVRIPLREQG